MNGKLETISERIAALLLSSSPSSRKCGQSLRMGIYVVRETSWIFLYALVTLHIGYMVIVYVVKSHILLILSWSKQGSVFIRLIEFMVYRIYGLFWLDKTVDHISDMQCTLVIPGYG